MAEVSLEKEEDSEVIYYADLEETKREIIDVLERSPEPILWTSEIVEEVGASRPTVLKHLNKLRDMGVVDKKENVDTVWWLVDEAEIWPGSKTGLVSTINRWISTSVQSDLERVLNQFVLLGAGLALLGMFFIIWAAYRLANGQNPMFFGFNLFSTGLIAGMFGFIFMLFKAGTVFGGYVTIGIQRVLTWVQTLR